MIPGKLPPMVLDANITVPLPALNEPPVPFTTSPPLSVAILVPTLSVNELFRIREPPTVKLLFKVYEPVRLIV